MTRIVAGTHKGRTLKVPPRGTRPTSDRVREALFSSLESRLGGEWSDVAFLDAFAGSGAVGLEAASRGAAQVTFVESAKGALATLRENIVALGVDAEVLDCRVESVGACAHGPATIAFADPPYELDDDALAQILERLQANRWIDEETLIVLERSARGGRNLLDDDAERKAYGETVLWYGRLGRRGGEA